MRNRILSTAVLLLAGTGVASAQQKAPAPEAGPAITQSWELGFRGTSTTGDEARYQRYQDLKSGLLSRIGISKETATSAWSFKAANVGYHDQSYSFNYNQFGKLKLSAEFTATPLNYAFNTLTPYKYAGNNVWTLDANARTQVQNKVPGVIGIGTNAATDVATIYRGLATNFPIESRRDVLKLGMNYRFNSIAAFDVKFSSTKKSGNQPIGASFAFSDAVELPMAVDTRTNDVTAGLELSKPKYGMVRAEWTFSDFKNNFTSLTWDNPLRATEYDSGKLPPAGPWDPSGYSNGNGAAYGRLSLAPSSNLNSFRVFGLYKLPNHTTLNANLSFTSAKQNAGILPFTTNTKIANAATYVYFPGLAALPRNTAEAELRGMNATVNFSTRPTDYFGFDLKYRYNDNKNETPLWDYSYNVRFDAVPEKVPGEESEHFNIKQNVLDAGTTFTLPNTSTALRLNYINDKSEREGRSFGSLTDHTFRVALDAYQNQYVNFRGIWESTKRGGTGFDDAAITDGGAQAALRFYDDAEVDRTKGTFILGLTPSARFDANLSLATGKDKYQGDGQRFGLLSNDNTSTNLSVNVYPTDKVTLGGSFGQEKFKSLQKSRNANPFSGVAGAYESWNDANRDWSLNTDETVKNAGLWIDLVKAMPNTDVRFSYDYSSSDQGFLHSGPRVQELSTNTALTTGDGKPCATGFTSCFIPLPNVTNTWSRIKVDVKHMFNAKMGAGLGYWYEKLDISDYATTNLADGSPRMDPLGEISTGYGNRPYTGSTVMARLIYIF